MHPDPTFFPNVLEVTSATLKDYQSLAEYHYIPGTIWLATSIYKIKARYPHHKTFPDPLAVIIYRMPLPDHRARTIATAGYFHRPATKSDRLKLVNKHIRYAARLIVDPRFQRRGLATKLLAESLKLIKFPIIETWSPIDFTNDILRKAGFTFYPLTAPTYYRKLTNAIASIGLTVNYKLLPVVLEHRIRSLGKEDRARIERVIHGFLHQFRHKQDMPAGIERSKYLLSKMPYPEAYLIWHNPDVTLPDYPEKLAEKSR